MNKEIKLIFVLMIFLVIAPLVSSQPVTNVQVSQPGTWDIRYPEFATVKTGQSFLLQTKAFNQTGILQTNETASCQMEIHSRTGVTTYSDYKMDWNGRSFESYIAFGNFTTPSEYAYVIFCNESSQGGFVSGLFQITKDGQTAEYKDSSSSIAVIIFLLFIISGLFFVPFKLTFSKNQLLQDMISRCFWILGLILLSLSTALLSTISNGAKLGILKELFRFLWVINWGIYLFIVWIVITFMFKCIKIFTESYNNKRMGGLNE